MKTGHFYRYHSLK